jgi:hypothetical protein
MSVRLRLAIAAAVLAAHTGCGPSVSEMRMIAAPPRAESCELSAVSPPMEELGGPKATWQVLGYVILSESGIQDPMQPEYRAIVGPRACAMGGEAIAITSATSAGGPLSTGGTGTVYMVLRHKPEPTITVQ